MPGIGSIGAIGRIIPVIPVSMFSELLGYTTSVFFVGLVLPTLAWCDCCILRVREKPSDVMVATIAEPVGVVSWSAVTDAFGGTSVIVAEAMCLDKLSG